MDGTKARRVTGDMAKKNNAAGLSALLLGFSVGSLAEIRGADLEKVVNYTPQVETEEKETPKTIEGASLDLTSTSMDASLWDTDGFFPGNSKKEEVVYVPKNDPDSQNESYTEMFNSLLEDIDIGDGFEP